ncbi:hypothetical protein [Agromyces atrinae]|uniref:FtsX-like permease family protein n=1 Tax=Agromyces atrinae TaxID=592376 RepID=A0A4Q2M9U3_9MICO|nr:hypothetical protein [Agromyces atrinae]NYD67352.1 hypothetical protein [Agromyces atrinae]RXZ86821.1 hypothetical protein ESP50_07075 [Agromyces atrinae]
MSLLGLSLIVADVSVVRALVDEGERFRDARGSVLTIAAEGRIDGQACDSLVEIDGVAHAGALREGDSFAAASLPGTPFDVYEVSGGLRAILLSSPVEPSGLVIARDIADTLGLVQGGRLATTAGEAPIAGIFESPPDGRRSGFGWALLETVDSSKPFDECWIDVWPTDARLAALLPLAMAPGSDLADEPPQLSQLNASLGREFAGAARFESRLTALAPVVALVAGAVVATLAVRRRRIELASHLHAGVTRRDMTLVMGIEAAVWGVAATLLTASAGVIAAHTMSSDDRAAIVVLSARIAVALFGGVIGGTLAASATIRERHLFAYFKDRT